MNSDLRDATAALRRELDNAPRLAHDSDEEAVSCDELALLDGPIPNTAEVLQCLEDFYEALSRDEPFRSALESRATLTERLTAGDTEFGKSAAGLTEAFGDALWKVDPKRPATAAVRPIIAGTDENNRADGKVVARRIRQRKQLLDLRGAIQYELEHTPEKTLASALDGLLRQCNIVIGETAALRVDECFWLWQCCIDRHTAEACLIGPGIVPFLRSALELVEDGSLLPKPIAPKQPRTKTNRTKRGDYGLTAKEEEQFYCIARTHGLASARRTFPKMKGTPESLMAKLKKQATQGVIPQVEPRTGKLKSRRGKRTGEK